MTCRPYVTIGLIFASKILMATAAQLHQISLAKTEFKLQFEHVDNLIKELGHTSDSSVARMVKGLVDAYNARIEKLLAMGEGLLNRREGAICVIRFNELCFNNQPVHR